MASKVSVATRYKNVTAEMNNGSTMQDALKKHKLAPSVFYRHKRKQDSSALKRAPVAKSQASRMTQSATIPRVLRTDNADSQRIIVRLRKEIVVYRRALGLEE